MVLLFHSENIIHTNQARNEADVHCVRRVDIELCFNVYINIPCKNSMNRSRSTICVLSCETSCSFILRGFTSWKAAETLIVIC